MKNLIIIFAIILSPLFATAGNDPFQGEIKYEISYEGEDADYMQMIGFSAYHYYFRDKKMRVHFEGGMSNYLDDFIINRETNESVMIDDAGKIVYTFEKEEADDASASDGSIDSVVKTKSKEEIMGYKCTKYVVTSKTDTSETVTEYWTTTKIKMNSTADIGFVPGLTHAGVDGFPLKIVTIIGGVRMIQVATYVSDKVPLKGKFVIPNNYTVKDFSESPIMQLVNENEEE